MLSDNEFINGIHEGPPVDSHKDLHSPTPVDRRSENDLSNRIPYFQYLQFGGRFQSLLNAGFALRRFILEGNHARPFPSQRQGKRREAPSPGYVVPTTGGINLRTETLILKKVKRRSSPRKVK